MKLMGSLSIIGWSLFLLSSWKSPITGQYEMAGRFDPSKDLLLAQFDCKTDVDDLHTAAAFKSLLSQTQYSDIKYHAVAGTYGEQEGLYVPPNSLFELAFGSNWTDAHANFDRAVIKVKNLASQTLDKGGNIWIAEAGQSDFSAALVKKILQENPKLDAKNRIHIVQHSEWNEEVTNKENLAYVRKTCRYHKIADGNAVGNGTPGFRTESFTDWEEKISDKQLLTIWQHAVELGNRYNGKENRYNNEAITKGGLDFSDLSETCWILGLENISDTKEFFNTFLTIK